MIVSLVRSTEDKMVEPKKDDGVCVVESIETERL